MTMYIESSWSQEHLLRILVRLLISLDEDKEYELYKYMDTNSYEAKHLGSDLLIINKETDEVEFNISKLLGDSIVINYI